MNTKQKEAAAAVFKQNKDIKEAFVTEDGQVFITENACKLHAAGTHRVKKQAYEKFNRSENVVSTSKKSESKKVTKKATKNGGKKNALPGKGVDALDSIPGQTKHEIRKDFMIEADQVPGLTHGEKADPSHTHAANAAKDADAKAVVTGGDKVDEARKKDDK